MSSPFPSLQATALPGGNIAVPDRPGGARDGIMKEKHSGSSYHVSKIKNRHNDYGKLCILVTEALSREEF